MQPVQLRSSEGNQQGPIWVMQKDQNSFWKQPGGHRSTEQLLLIQKIRKIENMVVILKEIGSWLPNSHFMFLIDIDLIAKIFKSLVDGSLGFCGVRLFENFQMLDFPTFWDL